MNSSLLYWIWLSSLLDVSLNAKAAVMEIFGSAEAAFHAPSGAFNGIDGITRRDAELLEARDLTVAELIPALCERAEVRILTIEDPDYPRRLKEIFSPPAVLYVRGRLPDLDSGVPVAVIGTRKASPYGIRMGRNIAYELSKCGSIVVSGLTQGVDAAAAEGALAAGGVCVGVLGTPITDAKNSLALRVCRRGALISEYAPGTPQRKSFFRDRNRIAAGISTGVVVTEAPEKSGTRLFFFFFLEQGKEIFAVPGNADSENSAGTIRFLREGAQLVTRGWEVAEELNLAYPGVLDPDCRETFPRLPEEAPKREEKKKPSAEASKKRLDKPQTHCYIDITDKLSALPEVQQQVALAVIAGSTGADQIIEATGLEAKVVLSALTMLEIRGITGRDASGRIIIREG